MTAAEHLGHGRDGEHGLLFGASPRTISDALLPADRPRFATVYEAALDEARLAAPATQAASSDYPQPPRRTAELVRRTARNAGIATWSKLSPHSLRHTAITLALDADAPLRDVQDFAGHRDARTTRPYDRARDDLDRSPTYALARWLTDRRDSAQV